jgi:hypothetical protein
MVVSDLVPTSNEQFPLSFTLVKRWVRGSTPQYLFSLDNGKYHSIFDLVPF